jgi:hypothetical protein
LSENERSDAHDRIEQAIPEGIRIIDAMRERERANFGVLEAGIAEQMSQLAVIREPKEWGSGRNVGDRCEAPLARPRPQGRRQGALARERPTWRALRARMA